MEPGLSNRPNLILKAYKFTRPFLLVRSDGLERRVALCTGLLSSRLPSRIVAGSGYPRPGNKIGRKGAMDRKMFRVKVCDEGR